MTYGITIQNTDSRVQIDENYTNIYLSTSTEQSANVYANYPPTGYSNGDLVFGRAKSNGHMGIGLNGLQRKWYFEPDAGDLPHLYDPPSSGYGYYIAKNYAGNVTSQNNYGFEVYNSSSQVVYSATAFNNNLTILQAGLIPAGSATEITFPVSGTYDLTNVYCLVNPTSNFLLEITLRESGFNILAGYTDFVTGYRYEYTSGNNGKIHICNKAYDGINNTEDVSFREFTYLIVEIVG